MEQENQKWNKVIELFFEYPNKRFTIREITGKTKIPPTSVNRYLRQLKADKLITNENKANITPYFKFRKTYYIIDKMFTSNLIEYLESKLNPSVIILFGGIRKGEYDFESDIDLLVETTKEDKCDLIKFEKILGHKIELFIKKDIH